MLLTPKRNVGLLDALVWRSSWLCHELELVSKLYLCISLDSDVLYD